MDGRVVPRNGGVLFSDLKRYFNNDDERVTRALRALGIEHPPRQPLTLEQAKLVIRKIHQIRGAYEIRRARIAL